MLLAGSSSMPGRSTRRNYLKMLSGSAALPAITGCIEQSVAGYQGRTSTYEKGLGCPSRDESTVYCAASDHADDLGMDLTSSKESVSLPKDNTEFTIYNNSEEGFYFNPYEWHIYKAYESEWHHIAPFRWHLPVVTLPPDENYKWKATIDNTDLDQLSYAEGRSEFTIEGLGGGTYSFYISGSFTAGESNEIGLAKRFKIQGKELSLTPTSSVTEANRREDTVIVYAENTDGDGGEKAEYVVTRRADASTGVKRMLTEQVFRHPPLRNTLSYFEPGVEKVKLVQKTNETPPFARHDEFTLVEYDDTIYEIDTGR